MSKLLEIKLHHDDQVRGNYVLMISGPVTHISPDHHYLVSEEQVKLLDEYGVKYITVVTKGREI